MNFEKFLRRPFLKNTAGRLLNKVVNSLQAKCSNFQYSYLQKDVIRLWHITYYISQTETKMKPPKRSILQNTPSGPAVKILKKSCEEGVHLLVTRCRPATYLTLPWQVVTKGLTYILKQTADKSYRFV